MLPPPQPPTPPSTAPFAPTPIDARQLRVCCPPREQRPSSRLRPSPPAPTARCPSRDPDGDEQTAQSPLLSALEERSAASEGQRAAAVSVGEPGSPALTTPRSGAAVSIAGSRGRATRGSVGQAGRHTVSTSCDSRESRYTDRRRQSIELSGVVSAAL